VVYVEFVAVPGAVTQEAPLKYCHRYCKTGVPPLAVTDSMVVAPLHIVASTGYTSIVGSGTTVTATWFEIVVLQSLPEAVTIT